MTFGKAGEATLSQWMAGNARVCWIEHGEPWTMESELISLRAQARQQARELPIRA